MEPPSSLRLSLPAFLLGRFLLPLPFSFSAQPQVRALAQPLTCWAPWVRPFLLDPAFSFCKL